MASIYDPLNGLRDAQGGYRPKKQTFPGGPNLTGNALDPAVQGRINGSGLGVDSGGNSVPDTLTIPGSTPDYGSLIANDPLFVQLQKDLAAQGAGDLASRNAAINRLFTGFGQLPDVNQAAQQLGIGDLGQAIDPTTGQLAAENPYSTTANLSKAHTTALRAIRQQLAARGLLQSGELGYRVGNENDAYGQATSDATQKLLDAISQIQGQFTSGQRAAQAQAGQGAESATTRQIGLNPPTGSKAAHLDLATGLYVDDGGNFWNGDGTPASKPTTPIDNTPAPPLPATQPNVIPDQHYGGLDIGAWLAPGVASGHRLDPRFSEV